MTVGISEMDCQSDCDGINSMKTVYAYLNGGLGNQMFQYATARALALRTGANLVLDSWSGFVRDFEYHRSYELHFLPIQARAATTLERAPIWLFRMDNKLRGKKKNVFQHRFYGNFLVETEMRYLPKIGIFDAVNTTWMVGYWQSPLYFQEYAKILRTELMPPQPIQAKFLDLGKILREKESVALGIRLYEESSNPAFDADDLKVKVAAVNSAILRLQKLQPKAQFFVFCTHRSSILTELKLPKSTVFVTHDDGYEGTIERLWLLAQCKHHIFTNSSYYWWGAWLSASLHSDAHGGCRYIFAEEKFNNRDGLCPEWQKF